ncbi:peptidase inhibitor family I36 protein [Micromonospora sp. KC721]|uniref:peptidase inhibitor family I36 protein n=1 Tax=Micromonospora sp. KC721 TaxID=2530380 RepID=UPI0014045CBC|nr:peptidase inhibitor family I36 protein [Micromonospora sp. KC721]
MRFRRRTLSALLAGALIAIGFGVGPSAEAAPDDRLQRLLAHNPGSRLAGPDSIITEQGVTLSLPSSTKANAKAAGVPDTLCSYEHLCLFSDAEFSGEKLTVGTDCDVFPIWQLKMSNGRYWGNEVSSYINNQKAGTWAFMWNNYGAIDTADRNNWELIEGSRAAGKGLAQGVAWMPRNDMVNVVRPCPGPW